MAHLWLTAFPWRRAIEIATLEFSDGSVEKNYTINGDLAPTGTAYAWNIVPSTATPILLPIPRSLSDQGVYAYFSGNTLQVGVLAAEDPGDDAIGTITLRHPNNSDIEIYVNITYFAPSGTGIGGPGIGPSPIGGEI